MSWTAQTDNISTWGMEAEQVQDWFFHGWFVSPGWFCGGSWTVSNDNTTTWAVY